MIISPSGDGHYFGSGGLGLDISAARDGEWFSTEPFRELSLSCELALGATPITSTLFAEFTTDPTKTRGISRVVLPEGSLHTDAATVTLPTARTTIALASAAHGACFSCSFSFPGVGFMRWRWSTPSGGSSPNRLYGILQGRHK